MSESRLETGIPQKHKVLAIHPRKHARGGARPSPKKPAKAKRLKQRPAKAKREKPRRKPARGAARKSFSARKNSSRAPRVPKELNGADAAEPDEMIPAAAGDVQTRIRELIKLAKEQGYLTFDDLNEALPADISDADELDAILTRLRRI